MSRPKRNAILKYRPALTRFFRPGVNLYMGASPEKPKTGPPMPPHPALALRVQTHRQSRCSLYFPEY